MSDSVEVYSPFALPLIVEGFGIATSTEMLPSSFIAMWHDLADAQWSQQLLLPNDAQTILSIALVKLGYSIDNPSAIELQQAREWLVELEPNLALLSGHDPEMHFLSGQISIGILSNREANFGNLEGGQLDLIWPEEGTVLDIYALSIANNTPQPENAYKLINFLLEQDSQQKIAQYSGLTPSTYDVERLKSTLVMIPNDVLSKGQFKQNNPDTRLKYEHAFLEIKESLATQ
jgi:spermidine/putrescine-binding protein